MDELFLFLNKYIPLQEKPRLLLPIVGLVILYFELHSLMYWSHKKLKRIHQLNQQQLQQLFRFQYWRRILICFLAIFLMWTLIFEIIL